MNHVENEEVNVSGEDRKILLDAMLTTEDGHPMVEGKAPLPPTWILVDRSTSDDIVFILTSDPSHWQIMFDVWVALPSVDYSSRIVRTGVVKGIEWLWSKSCSVRLTEDETDMIDSVTKMRAL